MFLFSFPSKKTLNIFINISLLKNYHNQNIKKSLLAYSRQSSTLLRLSSVSVLDFTIHLWNSSE